MKSKLIRLLSVSLFLLGSFSSLALAQEEDDAEDQKKEEVKKEEPKKEEAKKDDAKKDEKKQEGPKKDPKTVEYEKAIKDLVKTTGVFTFYQRKKDLLLELPEAKLNQLFLIQAAMGTGVSSIGLQAGEPLGAFEVDAYRLEKHDEQIWLVRPNFRYRWGKNDDLKISAERSLPEAILGSYRIEQTDPEKKLYLINATSLFYGELFRLNDAVNFILGGQYSLDRDKSSIESLKSFPDNSVVHTKLHYFSPRGAEGNELLEALGFGTTDQLEDSRSVPLKVTYNLWFRKDSAYVPRLADPRIGYFTTDFFNLDRFLNQDRTERYIHRFALAKKEPTAAQSEPVKPIVWTLDPSIPAAYRPAVKEGILRWNRAFDELGYKNAIVVQDPPADDKEYNHADGRYNVIRWTLSPDAAYAVSLYRVDPFTGEIINASVSVDANMLAYILDDYQHSTLATASAPARAMQALLRDPSRKESEDQFLWSTNKERAAKTMQGALGKLGWSKTRCEAQYGLAQHAAFGYYASMAAGLKMNKEEYARMFIADIVCHEVGHALGLRHNFVGSTYLTTDQLGDDALTSKENVAASVMDYTPVNVQAVLKGSGNFFGTTVGPYDRWAVSYGYSDFKSSAPLAEKLDLARIAAKSGLPGLAYMTDENADAWDPYVTRFDNAKDPIAYAAKNLEAARKMRAYAIQNLPKRGESYDMRTQLVLGSVIRTFREGRMAARFVGGLSASRSHRGDAVEKPTLAPVDPQTQRQAIKLAVQHCFAPDAFALPQSVLTSLSFDPSNTAMVGWNAPIRELIGSQQMTLFATLMSAGATDRIAENAIKWGARKDAYTIDEHFSILVGAVFKEVGTAKTIAPLRRDLQRFALTALMQQAGAPAGAINEDARTLAADSLRRLSSRFASADKVKGMDGMSAAHVRDAEATIKRFLDRHIATAR